MSTVGIVCEYNPFHKGHEYQIQQAKLLTGAEHVICFMSGNFLQRGVPAIADKHTRTEIALRCGVDAVFEIPFVYASSSARDYAHAAVCMMNALDGIDYISFGAECDDMDLLQKIAELTVNEPAQVSESIKKSVSSGISYGSARAAAISEYLQNQNLTGYTSADLDRILASPNNILAIEYIATLIQTDSRIKPVPIRRILSEYNSTATDNDICSASAIRELLRSGDVESLRRHIPDSCYNILQNAYRKSFPMFDDDLSHLLSARRILAPCTDDIVDMDRDLCNRLSRLDTNLSFTETATALKCRNYTLTHIQRGLLHTITDLRCDDYSHFKENGWIAYIKLLGLKKDAGAVIKSMKKASQVPIITRSAEIYKSTDSTGLSMFSYDIKATDIYRNMVYNKYKISIKTDFEQPVIVI